MSAQQGFVQFVNDDSGYLKWVGQNPHGFVINSNRVPLASYLILHRASCKWINNSSTTNWTTTGYIKTCSNDLQALATWANLKVGGSLKPCKSCQADSRRSITPPLRQIEPIVETKTNALEAWGLSPAATSPPPSKRSIPATISTGCPELDLAWKTFAEMIVNHSDIPIADTDDDLNWHAFLGHSTDMQGFRAGEFTGVESLTRKAPKFVPLRSRGIGVAELGGLWEIPEIRQHLLGQIKDLPVAASLEVLRNHGGGIGASLADAFHHFPWRKFHWSVRALLQNSAVLKPFQFSFRRWLQNECEGFGLQEFPPTNFRRAVTFQGTKIALERALRKRLEQTFYMVGPAMSAYTLCDWQLWLWREGITPVFAYFKLDLFHEAFVKKFGKGAIPVDEEGFARWWHGKLPDLPPRLANECIWLAVEKKLVDPWTPQPEGTPQKVEAKNGDPKRAKDAMHRILIERAKLGRTIPYNELIAQLKAIDFVQSSRILWDTLGAISTEEDAAGRGMLSVIVVHGQGDTLPGAGFFWLAESLGRDISDRRAFWIQELDKVFGSWSREGATVPGDHQQ